MPNCTAEELSYKDEFEIFVEASISILLFAISYLITFVNREKCLWN